MFGLGSGRVLLDDVHCTGEEDRLFECSHASIGNHFCGKLFFIDHIQSPHEFDVSISCEGMALLLSLHVTWLLLYTKTRYHTV